MRGFLTSKQPVWRVTMASVLTISLIFVISINLPSQAEELKEELVMGILQNDSEFLKAFGEEIDKIEIEHTTDNIAWVTVSGTSAHFMLQIDSSIKKITYYSGSRDPNDEEKAIVLQVLNTDPRARSLLDRGAIDYKIVSYASSPFQSPIPDKETTAEAWIALMLDPPQSFYDNKY